MPATRIEDLEIRSNRRRRLQDSRLWREWCFARVVFRHFRFRFFIISSILTIGTLLFWSLERHSIPEAAYFTWSLAFGEPPEDFPDSFPLQVLFFVLPVAGLVIILEAIIDFALILRERGRSERSWCMMMTSAMSNHIVLVGMGRLGYRTYCLLRKLGESVVVIERDAENQFLDELRRDGVPLFIGDARRESILEDANISQARSIILASNDDLANLEIALDARKIRPGIRVVLRMFDQNMADKIREGFNIHIAMSQSAISAPAFATAAIDKSIVNSFVIDNRLIVMQRWAVQHDGPLCGKTIADLMSELNVGVVERRVAGGEPVLFPAPDTRIGENDQLLVQGRFEVLAELKRSSAEAQPV